MALTSTPTDLRTETVYWTAICSNRTRTIEECKTETDTTLKRIGQLELTGTLTALDLLAPIVSTIYINRDKDLAFIEMLMTYENKTMWEEGLVLYINEKQDALRDKYMAAYIEKWGETRELLLLKLSYLSLFDVYPQNVNEVERIITLLGAAAPTSDITTA